MARVFRIPSISIELPLSDEQEHVVDLVTDAVRIARERRLPERTSELVNDARGFLRELALRRKRRR